MKVKILKNTVASGYVCEAGKTIDLSDKDAHTLIAMGKAEIVDTDSKQRVKSAKTE